MEGPIPVPPTIAGDLVAVPYPGRSHVNSIMTLVKLLVSKNPNILVTFVVTEEWLGLIGCAPKSNNIRFATIPNIIPSEEGRANDFVGFFEAVMTKMEAPFEELLHRLEPPPTIMISDSVVFWVVRVGNRRNIPVASFWPASASWFFAVLKHFHLLEQNGHYPVSVTEDGEKRVDYIPGSSSICLADFPLNDDNWQSRKLSQMVLNVVAWVHKAQYLLFHSIYEIEPQAIHTLKQELSIPIYTIASPIPYFDNSHVESVKNNNVDLDYFPWLNNQPSSSVLYVSQGSFLSVSNEQIEEIAAGLRDSGVRFLWIQRGESSRLKEICGKKGLIVPWCEQLRVLQHPSIGGFWSHCGWNSTREGVFCGVPFLAFPISFDQHLNSKMIVEDWKVGWRVKTEVKVKEGTLIKKDEIANLVRMFMDLDSDEGRDMRKRVRELQKLCQRAIARGGSSETNMNDFLGHIFEGAKPE